MATRPLYILATLKMAPLTDKSYATEIFKLSIAKYCIWNRKAVASFFKYLKILLLMELIFLLAVDRSDARLMTKNRKTAFMQGNILIGALVSVHNMPKQETASLLECGEIREQYGIQRVEAAFLAVDRINEDGKLLPNITLGIEIRDSCWYPSIALEQSIEFIRDAITGPEGGNSTSPPGNCAPKAPVPPPSSKNLVGVIGPGSSAVTIQVQNLLQLFRIPQVGYSATSKDLSDKSRFSYFLRVVPSDYYQAQVMVDIVKHYNWTYVSAVHTDGNYGQSGITAFREVAEENNICIAKEDTVLSNAEDAAFDDVIRGLAEDNRANVVVCFCEGMTVRNLLRATQRLKKVRRFLFLGSDGWADRSDVVVGLEEAALGGLSVKIQSNYVTGFDEYYFSLRPDNNSRNPWFREFWEHRFNCTLRNENETKENSSKEFSKENSSKKNSSNEGVKTKYAPDGSPYCTGKEKLSEGYKQDTKMAFVVKATYTMAHGLHAMHQDLCEGKPGLCLAMSPINGSLLRDYLMNVTFTYLNETVTFDSRGDPPGRYDIMNFQKLGNGSYEYVKVATWDNGTLTVDEDRVVFNGSDKTPPSSVCSMPCDPGQVKSFIDTGDHLQKCCWICNDCEEEEYLSEETKCSPCHKDYWPNASKTGCDLIPVEYIDWNDDEAIAALTIAALGFFATCFVMVVFIKYNHTPVVKASTRELSYIIFVGMMVSYFSSLPLLHIPTKLTCAFSRILPGFSFSMIYAALVTKTNRIARILAGNKKIMTRNLRFMSATAQVVITCCLISIELGIILFMLIHQPPEAINSYPKPGKVVAICNTTPLAIIAPMGWDFFLILLCTVYAVKTRNLPENFNEAKFIGFSMYTTCVIWLAWMAIYFGSDHKVICMSICTSLSAFVTLILLFFPKIYIILCRPEKNDRSAFKTTTIRWHIGSSTKPTKSSSQDRNPLSLVESPSCASSVYTNTESKWSGLLLRMRGALPPHHQQQQQQQQQSQGPQKSRSAQSMKEQSKTFLRRETSIWSDVSVSPSSVVQHRDFLLQKAYGSQLDLADGESCRWSHEEKGIQTSDDLLDPLIPRMRRRVTMAVREGTLSRPEGREFFDLTQDFLQTKEYSSSWRLTPLKEEEEQTHLKSISKELNNQDVVSTGHRNCVIHDAKNVDYENIIKNCTLGNSDNNDVQNSPNKINSVSDDDIRYKKIRRLIISDKVTVIGEEFCPNTTKADVVPNKRNIIKYFCTPRKIFNVRKSNLSDCNNDLKNLEKNTDCDIDTIIIKIGDSSISSEKSNKISTEFNLQNEGNSIEINKPKKINHEEDETTDNKLTSAFVSSPPSSVVKKKRRENELIVLGLLRRRSILGAKRFLDQRKQLRRSSDSNSQKRLIRSKSLTKKLRQGSLPASAVKSRKGLSNRNDKAELELKNYSNDNRSFVDETLSKNNGQLPFVSLYNTIENNQIQNIQPKKKLNIIKIPVPNIPSVSPGYDQLNRIEKNTDNLITINSSFIIPSYCASNPFIKETCKPIYSFPTVFTSSTNSLNYETLPTPSQSNSPKNIVPLKGTISSATKKKQRNVGQSPNPVPNKNAWKESIPHTDSKIGNIVQTDCGHVQKNWDAEKVSEANMSEGEVSADESFSTIEEFFDTNGMKFAPLVKKPKLV